MATFFVKNKNLSEQIANINKPLYQFLLNKWYFDELYESRPAAALDCIVKTNFEDESIDFHTKVSNGFRTLAKKSDKWVIVNGSLDINQISEIIWKSVEQLFD